MYDINKENVKAVPGTKLGMLRGKLLEILQSCYSTHSPILPIHFFVNLPTVLRKGADNVLADFPQQMTPGVKTYLLPNVRDQQIAHKDLFFYELTADDPFCLFRHPEQIV